jgi:hypothetical protein
MAEDNIHPSYKEWSVLLRRIILNEMQRPSREIVRNLTVKDIRILREIAQEKDPAEEIRQDKILAVLAECAPDAETVKLLERIIDDPERPALLRTVSAIELSRIPLAESEKILLRHLTDSNPHIAQRVIQAISKIGDEKALRKLEAMKHPENPHVRRQWEFGKKLIRHRLGLSKSEPPQTMNKKWDMEKTEDWRPMTLKPVSPEEIKSYIDDIENLVAGVEIADSRGYVIKVNNSVQYLLTSQQLTTNNGIKQLFKVPMVAAVIAMWEQRTNKLVLEQVVLSEPYKDGLLIQSFRMDGTLLFEGYGHTSGEHKATFKVRDVSLPDQCRFQISGEIDPENFAAIAATIPGYKRRPRSTHSLI